MPLGRAGERGGLCWKASAANVVGWNATASWPIFDDEMCHLAVEGWVENVRAGTCGAAEYCTPSAAVWEPVSAMRRQYIGSSVNKAEMVALTSRAAARGRGGGAGGGPGSDGGGRGGRDAQGKGRGRGKARARRKCNPVVEARDRGRGRGRGRGGRGRRGRCLCGCSQCQ